MLDKSREVTMHQALQDLQSPFSLLINTNHDTHLNSYHLLDYLPLPTICASLHRPANNLKKMLDRKSIPTDNMHFIDTVSIRSSSSCPADNTFYLWNHDLTRLGQAILDNAAKIPGKKHVIIDSVSTLRHFYSQATINEFIYYLKQRLPEVNANGIFLNENHKPWIPNFQFSKVLEL